MSLIYGKQFSCLCWVGLFLIKTKLEQKFLRTFVMLVVAIVWHPPLAILDFAPF